jgi:DnaJ-class molecular chaperone
MKLTLDDLWEKCPKCNGTGWYKETSGSTGSVGIKTIREGTCDQCFGTGGNPTEQGEVIAQFIQHLKQASRI